MASLYAESRGGKNSGRIYWTIQFVDAGGKRRSIRLGSIPKEAAEEIQGKVETILQSKKMGADIGPKLFRWLADLPDELAKKLARAGLIESRANDRKAIPTLGEYIDIYLDGKPHLKASTRTTFRTALQSAITAIGTKRRLNEVDERIAGSMVRSMLENKYSKAYVAKAVIVMKSMFRTAIREKLVESNPFEYLPAGSQVNDARKVFIAPEIIKKLIGTLPGLEWPLLVALARWGGLRTPSEPFALKWGHVLWDQNRLIVPTPKLEHLPGRATRIIPIFPEILPYLRAAFDAAEEGEEYVFPRLRKLSGNVSSQLHKFILRAGLKEWPRTWQNLRASRSTELADLFPSHVAAAWLGHTAEIADKCYRSVLDSHFEKALHSALQTESATECKEAQNGTSGNEETTGKACFPVVSEESGVGATGFQTLQKTSGNTAISTEGAAHRVVDIAALVATLTPEQLVATLTPEQRAALAQLLNG